MKKLALLLTAALLTLLALRAPAAEVYVCPPCGTECHGPEYEFSAAGACPVCGMALVVQNAITNVAILIFPGVQIIDYTGPYEVFGQAGWNVYTVATSKDPIRTAMGMEVIPAYTLADAPAPDIVVVPGGDVHATQADETVQAWLRRQERDSDQILSVCNGAFILAEAGLLDGLSATTFYGLLGELEDFAQKTKVVRDERFVDNGKIITTAGLSSGIDGSLHVVEKRLGLGRAEQVALHLEYPWNPDSQEGFARGAVAHVYIEKMPRLFAGQVARRLTTNGDRDHWRVVYEVETENVPADVHASIVQKFEGTKPWVSAGHPGATGSDWKMANDDGEDWLAHIDVAAGAKAQHIEVTVNVKRAGLRISKR